MTISTAEREQRLSDAIDYYYSHEGSIPVREVAKKFLVNHVTLGNRINGKHQSISHNGGHNRLLIVTQLGALFLYIQRQALSGFPCTWAMILGAVTWIRAQDGLSPPSMSWSKKFQRKNGPIIRGGFHKIKWKPMDAKRRAAQCPKLVIEWFQGLERIRKHFGIGPENMWNFDETGVRNACPASTWVWVPTSIKEVYSI